MLQKQPQHIFCKLALVRNRDLPRNRETNAPKNKRSLPESSRWICYILQPTQLERKSEIERAPNIED